MHISYICITLCFYCSVVFTSELPTDLMPIGFLDNDGQVHTLKIKQQDIQKSGTLKNLMDDIPKNLVSDTSKPLKRPINIKGLSSSNFEIIQEIFNVLDKADTLERVLRETPDNDLSVMLTIADYFEIPTVYDESLKIMIERILADKEKYKYIDIDKNDYFINNHNIKNSIKKELIKNIHPTFKNIHTLKGHTKHIHSVALSRDGHLIASGSYDRSIKIWDVASQQCIGTLRDTSQVHSATFSNDDHFIVSGAWDGTIKIWDVASQQCIDTLLGHRKGVTTVALRNDDRFLVSGSYDWSIKIWDMVNQQCIGTLLGHEAYVTTVAWSRNGRFLVSGSWDNTIKIWDVASQQCIGTLGQTSRVRSATFSNDDRFIVSGSDKAIQIWDVVSQQCIGTLLGHEDYVATVAWSRNGRFLVSGSWDNTIKIWDVASQQCIDTLGHTSQVYSATFSNDDRFIVSGSWDGTIKIWDNITHFNTNHTIAEILSIISMPDKMRWKQRISMFSGIGAGISLSYLVYKYLQ